ncbi:MAG: hypothetical protein ACLVHV_03200 [Oscillospiraceae bacterium]
MKKLPSLTEMEHITSKEFGENMDAILDRITDEDIALIIDHNSKSYVLCPASWFDLREPKHLELMVRNAVRFVVSVDNSDLTELCRWSRMWLRLSRQSASAVSLNWSTVEMPRQAIMSGMNCDRL